MTKDNCQDILQENVSSMVEKIKAMDWVLAGPESEDRIQHVYDERQTIDIYVKTLALSFSVDPRVK